MYHATTNQKRAGIAALTLERSGLQSQGYQG